MSEDFLGLFDQETEVVILAPGEALFEKGEPGRLMYVVARAAGECAWLFPVVARKRPRARTKPG